MVVLPFLVTQTTLVLPPLGNTLRLATFRSGHDFSDRFSSTGRRFSWRSLRSFGWLGIIRSSEGPHGHGEAPGKAPARENAQALRLATFRSGDDFGDLFSSTGRSFSWRSLRSSGWLGTVRSSEGTHGHGEAPGEAPARENAKTGHSPDVGLLDSGKRTLSWIGFCSWEGLRT